MEILLEGRMGLELDEGSIHSLEDGVLGESAGDQSNMEEALTINYDEIIGERHGESIVVEGDVASEKVKMTVGHCLDEVEPIVEDGDDVSGKMKMIAAHTADEVQPIMEEGRVDVSEVMKMTADRASNEVEATNCLLLPIVPIAEPICSVETLEVKHG